MTDLLTKAKTFYSEVLADPAAVCEALLADGFVLENYLPDHVPFGGRYEGREGFLRYLGELATAIDMGPLEIDEWLADSTCVAIRGQEQSVVRATGREYRMRFVHWLTFDVDGRIVHMREFNDTAVMGAAFGA